jgi:hypothetical protein
MRAFKSLLFVAFVVVALWKQSGPVGATCGYYQHQVACGTSCSDATSHLVSCTTYCAGHCGATWGGDTIVSVVCGGDCSNPTPYSADRECGCYNYCDQGSRCTPGYQPLPAGSCTPPTQLEYDGCGCWRCYNQSPLIMTTDFAAVPKLSSATSGVQFDLLNNGHPVLMAWPTDATSGWLVLDRNGNGEIDSGAEMFGTSTLLPDGVPAEDGFVALTALDENGDGALDQSDSTFAQLRLWIDSQRDGHVEAGELLPLDALMITSIDLAPKASQKQDQWGNQFLKRSKVHASTSPTTRYIYDVYPQTAGGT